MNKSINKNMDAYSDDIIKTKSIEKSDGIPDNEAMKLISEFSRKELKSEDVYTFSVILCDNDIDRDFEMFSVEALHTLAKMFKGVTGIFDHSMKSSDQTARIYKTQVIEDDSKLNSQGDKYTYLKAWCYMLRNQKNSELIAEIDGGIKKEVSVSCAVSSCTCSVCGKDIRSRNCSHSPGSVIDGKICHAVLNNPTDAYEWSFVAVPAQRNAGVSKSFSHKFKEKCNVDSDGSQSVTLTKSRFDELMKYIEETENKASAAADFREKTEKDIIAMSCFTLPNADGKMLSSILKKLDMKELDMLYHAFEKRADALGVYSAQLETQTKADFKDNSEFKI